MNRRAASHELSHEQRLAALISSLPEPNQRVEVFAQAMERLSPGQATQQLGASIARSVRTRTRDSRLLVETAMLCLLHRRWSAAHLEAARRAAADSRLDLVYLILANISDAAEPGNAAEPVPNYTGGARPLTLGERRSIARQPDRQMLSRALLDPHPMVVARVLANPRINENDVIFMASRRSASPAVLREIAMHQRWRLNRRIAFALLCNPALPPGLGLSLLPGLDPARLAQIAADNTSAGLLRHVARCLLKLREENDQAPAETTDN